MEPILYERRHIANRRSNKPTPNSQETAAQLRDEDHTKKEREHIEKIDVQR